MTQNRPLNWSQLTTLAKGFQVHLHLASGFMIEWVEQVNIINLPRGGMLFHPGWRYSLPLSERIPMRFFLTLAKIYPLRYLSFAPCWHPSAITDLASDRPGLRHQQKRTLRLIRRRCVLMQATHLLCPIRPVHPNLRCNAPPHPPLPDATWQRSLRPGATWRPPYVWTTPDSFSHLFFLLMRR